MVGRDCALGLLWLGATLAEVLLAQGLGSRQTPVFGGKEGRDGGI